LTIIRTHDEAVAIFLEALYTDGTLDEQRVSRNSHIRQLFDEGVTKTEIGRRFGISARRVTQILEGK
jgi:DNA-directed RNA polymerase sigma subunit (sigma70/sigma32)